jgi:hypothetical protein
LDWHEGIAIPPRPTKNKLEKSGVFFGAKKMGLNSHASPPNHHNITTKTPRKKHSFFQNPY